MCWQYVKEMTKICYKYEKIYIRYVQDFLKISSNYATDMQKIERYEQDKFKISLKYLHTFNISPSLTKTPLYKYSLNIMVDLPLYSLQTSCWPYIDQIIIYLLILIEFEATNIIHNEQIK